MLTGSIVASTREAELSAEALREAQRDYPVPAAHRSDSARLVPRPSSAITGKGQHTGARQGRRLVHEAERRRRIAAKPV